MQDTEIKSISHVSKKKVKNVCFLVLIHQLHFLEKIKNILTEVL